MQLICRRSLFYFRTITPQDYLMNQRESGLTRRPHETQLFPLQKNNQGDSLVSDQIKLIGVPKGAPIQVKQFDIFQQVLTQGERDLIFLQIDPSPYIARERFVSHKCSMGQVQDYRLDGVELIDPHKPITWEQSVVNLLTLDMVRQNKFPKQIEYKKGLYAYSYPYLQQNDHSKAITNVFANEISDKILGGKRTGYDLIDRILYTSLMGKHKVMLGGMPQTLTRMILGKALSIHEMRDVFRTVLQKNNMMTIPFSSKDATQNFLPHIFNLPKDLYMTAMLKQSFQAAMQMVAVVGIQSWRPIQQYWVPPPWGVNMTQATRIPQGFPGQTAQDLIQKQAIMDVLLQTRTWSKKYLSNPFPYLFQDITKVDKQELQNYKKIFLKHYRKYSEFKKRQSKALPSGQRQKMLLLDSNIKKQKEQMTKMDNKTDFVLKHLKNKMNMQSKKIKLKSS